jgi:hypothetical protein
VQVSPGNPEDLPFANHLCCLNPLNDCPCRRFRPWSLHGSQAPLDMTVIGFDPVIAVPSSALSATV